MELIKKHIRAIPDFPKPGILFRDTIHIMKSPEALKRTTELLAERYAGEKVDLIAGIEARGFLFGTALAQALALPFIAIRKPGKLPGEIVRKEYDLEYGTDTIEMQADAVEKNQRVLIVDDLLATGGTARAAADLVVEVGGEVVECAFIVELAGLNGKARLGDHKSHALVTYPGA